MKPDEQNSAIVQRAELIEAVVRRHHTGNPTMVALAVACTAACKSPPADPVLRKKTYAWASVLLTMMTDLNKYSPLLTADIDDGTA